VDVEVALVHFKRDSAVGNVEAKLAVTSVVVFEAAMRVFEIFVTEGFNGLCE
jgi:hypothetical protein